MADTPLSQILNRQRRANHIMLVLALLTIIGVIGLQSYLWYTEASIKNTENSITETTQSIKKITENRNFMQYKKNTSFLSQNTAIAYSTYIQELTEKLGKNTLIKNIQTQVKSEDPLARKVDFFVSLESTPSFLETKSIITSLKTSKKFTAPDINSLSLTKNEAGKDSFQFPLTLSLNTNADTKTTK